MPTVTLVVVTVKRSVDRRMIITELGCQKQLIYGVEIQRKCHAGKLLADLPGERAKEWCRRWGVERARPVFVAHVVGPRCHVPFIVKRVNQPTAEAKPFGFLTIGVSTILGAIIELDDTLQLR